VAERTGSGLVREGSLVVLVGPSGSGKTTWADAVFGPGQVVSADRLRAVVGHGEHDLAASADAFDVLDRIVAARVGRRLTTVVDTLGLDPDRRRAWRALAASAGVPCVAVAFDTPPAQCRRRNAARARPVPARVLSGQVRSYAEQRPGLETEGFDAVLAAGTVDVRVVAPEVAAAARVVEGPPPSAVAPAVPPPAGAPLPAPGGLRFGLHLSRFEVPGGPAELAERLRDVAGRAERAGFASLWVMDHFRQIPQLGRPWENMPEAAVTLATLAAATRTATVGCLVHCVTYRNVGLLGRTVATLDVLSGGRAWCGLGAGWFEAEHAGYGWPFPGARERLDLLEDALEALPVLWGPGAHAFTGRRIRLPEAMGYPRPLRGRVPILVGGGGERRTLRLVAQHADACNLTGDVDTVRHKVAVLERHCADVGRDPGSVEVTHLSTVRVEAGGPRPAGPSGPAGSPRAGGTARGVRAVAGTVADHVLRVRALRAVGVQHVIVSLDGLWDTPAVEAFGEVIAACADG